MSSRKSGFIVNYPGKDGLTVWGVVRHDEQTPAVTKGERVLIRITDCNQVALKDDGGSPRVVIKSSKDVKIKGFID